MSFTVMRRAGWLFLALFGWVCFPGCVSVDRYHREWALRSQTGRDAADSTEKAIENGAPAERLAIGMSKEEIREIAGALIEETNEYVWKLRNQFCPFSPGLYPFFDWREIYLYFDHENLAALIVRGSYNVYP